MKYKLKTLLASGLFLFTISPVHAALVDGVIGPNYAEYQWNTGGASSSEFNDGSGGDKWDINYFGVDVAKDEGVRKFQFGLEGGSILTGSNSYRGENILLGDIALDVGANNSWEYAIRLEQDSFDDQSGPLFTLYKVDQWMGGGQGSGPDPFYPQPFSASTTDKFQMFSGSQIGDQFRGNFSPAQVGDPDSYVLEGSFDLGLLSLFDEKQGGEIISYITMSCVNDEAYVRADISAVPLPASAWLFATALIGFVGMSSRKKI